MLTVNEIPLDNRERGWWMRPESNPFTGLTLEAQHVAGSRHGHVPVPSRHGAPVWPIVVLVDDHELENLNAIFSAPRLTFRSVAHPGRTIEGRMLTSSPSVFPGGRLIDMTYVIEFGGVFWRSEETTAPSTLLSAASVVVRCMDADGGLSAPVDDAVVRVKGSATALRVADSGGSWFTFPAVPSGQWLRFEAATGRAFLTTTDTWTGGTEVSGDVDFGGPRGTFEITPHLPNPLDPTAREGRLTVATAARTGASIQVKARAAHLV